MSESKHTPGPWFVSSYKSEVKIGGRFVEVRDILNADDHNDKSVLLDAKTVADVVTETPTQWANARLMAAAPDLLDALSELIDTIQSVDPGVYSDAISYAQEAIDAALVEQSR